MREHDAAARRTVARGAIVGGAIVLAAALGAVGIASWIVLRMGREADAERARDRILEAIDDAVEARIAARDLVWERTEFQFDDSLRPLAPLPRPFDSLPPIADAAAEFWIRQTDIDGSPAIRRAAAELAVASDDASARLVAALRGCLAAGEHDAGIAAAWCERARIPERLASTREAVLLQALAGSPEAVERALDAIGSEDDEPAAATLVTAAGSGAEEALRVVRKRRRSQRLLKALPASFHRLGERSFGLEFDETQDPPVVSISRGEDGQHDIHFAMDPWGQYRLGIAADGGAFVAIQGRRGVAMHLRDPEWVAAHLRQPLAARGVRLVPSERHSPSPEEVAVEIPDEHVAVADAPTADPVRSLPLLAGLGVVAAGSVVAYAAFVRAVRREARAAAARADFVATVSHELRTPVAVVRTSAETLLADRAPRDEDRRTLLGAILRESERLSSLLGNVLDFARMDAGTRRYAFRDVAVRDLVEETVRRTGPTLAAGGFRVDVEMPADPGTVRADPDTLGAALANLLDNAAKYRGTGDRATVRVSADPSIVTIDVEDHGVGVPDAEKPHVFERFFRGSDPRVRETRGSGIGLALVRHAVEAHGGKVSVRDTPGGGATFRVVLPRRGGD